MKSAFGVRLQINECSLQLVQGNITSQNVDAIVNAANSRLAGGGGVDGAIHSAGGPSIMEETDRRYPKGCETGGAVISSAGNLSCKYVIHAVGPVWNGGLRGESDLLRSAFQNSLALAVEHHCDSLALPAISTGVYGYPMDLAAQQSLMAVADFLREHDSPKLVKFVLFDAGAYGAFSYALENVAEVVKNW